MDIQGKIVNFIGDSITEGVGATSPNLCFVARVKQKVDLKEARNYGISGTRFAKQTKPTEPRSFDQDFCSRYREMDKVADVIVVFGGTNDYGHGDAPLGKAEDRTSETFYGACHELFSGLSNEFAKSHIVVLTPLPRTDAQREGRNLSDYARIIKEVAAQYSLPVLDLFFGVSHDSRIQEIYASCLPDGVHPDDKGHDLLADIIIDFLKGLS